jgi:hypothetical protein
MKINTQSSSELYDQQQDQISQFYDNIVNTVESN